jgi:hypothetical protein
MEVLLLKYSASTKLVIGSERGPTKDFGSWHFFFRNNLDQR